MNSKGWEQTRLKMLRECPGVIEMRDEYIFQIANKKVLCSHFPWVDVEDERHGIKYIEYRPRRHDYPGVSFLLHGHKHSGPLNRFGDRSFDVGFDGIGRAYSYEEIEEIITNART